VSSDVIYQSKGALIQFIGTNELPGLLVKGAIEVGSGDETVNEETLIKFNTSRSWEFQATGSAGSSQHLELKNVYGNSKNFRVVTDGYCTFKNQDGTNTAAIRCLNGSGEFNCQGDDGVGILIGDQPEFKIEQESNAFRFEVGGTGYGSRPMAIGRSDNSNDVYMPGRLGVGCGVGASFDNGDDEYQLMITSSGQDHYLMFLRNAGSSYDHRGLEISCGRSADAGGTDQYFVSFTSNGAPGEGVSGPDGTITGNNGTVAYNTFTGVHIGEIEDWNKEDYKYGLLMRIKSVTTRLSKSAQPEYVFERSTTAQDPTVMGVYFSYAHATGGDPDIPMEGHFDVAALGDGHIWVCDENGDIDPGDYIVSSTVVGHGQKQADNIMRNYTVAKVTEGVTWAEVSGSTKLLACTYHCG